MIPLLLLLPAFYCGGKVIGNYLEYKRAEIAGRPLREQQAQHAKELEAFKQAQAEKLAADNARTAEQCRRITEVLKALPPEYWEARKAYAQ
jgi:hypothetical protein